MELPAGAAEIIDSTLIADVMPGLVVVQGGAVVFLEGFVMTARSVWLTCAVELGAVVLYNFWSSRRKIEAFPVFREALFRQELEILKSRSNLLKCLDFD